MSFFSFSFSVCTCDDDVLSVIDMLARFSSSHKRSKISIAEYVAPTTTKDGPSPHECDKGNKQAS